MSSARTTRTGSSNSPWDLSGLRVRFGPPAYLRTTGAVSTWPLEPGLHLLRPEGLRRVDPQHASRHGPSRQPRRAREKRGGSDLYERVDRGDVDQHVFHHSNEKEG